MRIKFRDHAITFILVPLVVLVGVVSFYRFIVKQEYLVSYEIPCDPAQEKCFMGYNDDEYNHQYFFKKIEKYAPDLYMECGNNITDCQLANSCLENDKKCSVIYCDDTLSGDVCFSYSRPGGGIDKSGSAVENYFNSENQKNL